MELQKQALRDIVNELPQFSMESASKSDSRVFGYDSCHAIPKGKRALGWWHVSQDGPICHILCLDSRSGGISCGYQYMSSFDDIISAGTIVSGTLFVVKERSFFAMSDVYQYAGTMISNIGYSRRETYIAVIGRHLNPINYNTQCITFGKPVSAVSYKELSVKIRDLSYEVSSIVYSHHDWGVGKIRPFIAHGQSTHKAHECVFAVTPHVSQDVYELRCQDSSALRWACVQSLAESIKLNKSFRKIRENDDVDLGEISPDESEFEDIDPAKYIKRRTIRMTCRYDYKFRKWHILAPTKEQLSLETEVRTGESSRYSTR